MCECKLIEQLIDKLSHEGNPDEHSSVEQLLCNIVKCSQEVNLNGSESQGSPSNNNTNKLFSVIERYVINLKSGYIKYLVCICILICK